MPTGFSSPSGNTLPANLVKLIPLFISHLKALRAAGTATPSRPIAAKTYCRLVHLNFGWHLTDVDVRAMVNHCRRRAYPIASTSKGYFYALARAELTDTILHLDDRASAIHAVVHGLHNSFPEYAVQPELLH